MSLLHARAQSKKNIARPFFRNAFPRIRVSPARGEPPSILEHPSASFDAVFASAVNLRFPRREERGHTTRPSVFTFCSLTRELFEVTVGKGADLLPVYYTTTTRFNEARNTGSRRILNCGCAAAEESLARASRVTLYRQRGGYIVNPATMFHSARLLSHHG